MFVPGTISKAIAAGLVSAIVALAARYGFQAQPETVTALGVIVTALVSYVIGHAVVYFARNKAATGTVTIFGTVGRKA